MKQTRNWRSLLFAISALVLALDRFTKNWVSHHIQEGNAITVIPRVFRISHVQNPGAAFSMFSESANPDRTRWILIAFSLLAAAVVLGILLRIGRRLTMTSLAMALVLGGAIGNAWDRIRFGTVVDFLEVHIVHYHWPDFNVADSAIVIGGILLLLDALFSRQPSSSEERPNA